MATTSGTLWNEKLIYSGAPNVKATATYEYERNGTNLKLKIDNTSHCIANGAYWDWRWAFSVYVNDIEVSSNNQIKPRTYLNIIGQTHYSGSTGWLNVNIGSASSIKITIKYFDTVANNNDRIRTVMGEYSFTVGGIPPLPNVSLSENNKGYNTIIFNYSVSSNYDYVRVWVNNQQYGDYTNSPITLAGLNPNTTYTISAKAFGNGGFGNQSNTLRITTYLKPSVVDSNSVGNIQPFSCTAYVSSSNTNNTSKYEFALCNSNKGVVQGAFQTNSAYYNFTGLSEETTYCIRYRVQSKDSGAWSNYVYSQLFKTPADQVRAYFKNNSNWAQGKMYVKNNGQWKKVKKAYIKINGVWVLVRNR